MFRRFEAASAPFSGNSSVFLHQAFVSKMNHYRCFHASFRSILQAKIFNILLDLEW